MMDERDISRLLRVRPAAHQKRRRWTCPPLDHIAAYVDQTLAAEAKVKLERHLADCGTCLELTCFVARQQNVELEAPHYLVQHASNAIPAKAFAFKRWQWALAPMMAVIVVCSAVLLRPVKPAPLTMPHTASSEMKAVQAPVAAKVALQRNPAKPAVRSLQPATRKLELLQPRSGSTLTTEALRFRWPPLSNAVEYEIRIVNAEGDPAWSTKSNVPAVNLPRDVALPPGKYFVWLLARLGDGQTLRSEAIPIRISNSR